MENAFYIVLAPWLVFIVFAFVAKLLISFAKKRRGVAMAFAVFMQIFSPVPFVERADKTFIVEKRQVKKQQDGEMLDKSKK